jgi:hypothetical protein
MSQHTLFRLARVVAPASVLFSLAACSGADSSTISPIDPVGGATTLAVSFAHAGALGTPRVAGSMTPGVSAAIGTSAATGVVIVGTANDTMVISQVQMVIGNVKLRRAGVAACPDTIQPSKQRGKSADERGCSRLDLGPMLLDLPLTGTGVSPLAVSVPAGTYSAVEFELDDVKTGIRAPAGDSAFLVAHPEFRDVTVKVTGTYKGTAFTFLSRAEAEVEFEFNPALTMAAGVNDNLTVALDLTKWFKSATGGIVAPTVANQLRIDQNILTSFNAFGDRDRDGKEDSGRNRSSGRDKNGSGKSGSGGNG